MDIFETVDDSVDSSITKIYEKICELPPKKYKKDRAIYETITDKTREHNAEVEQIKAIISSWDIRKVMNDPYSLKQEHLDECANAAKLLKKYKKKDDVVVVFETSVENINNNLEEIRRQFDLHKQYDALFDFEKEEYINLQKKHEVEKRVTQ